MVISLGNDFTLVFQPWSIQLWPLLKDNDIFPRVTTILKTIILKENNRPRFLAKMFFHSFMQHNLKCCVFF